MQLRLVPSFWTQAGLAASILFPSAWVVQKFLGNIALAIYVLAGLWFFLAGYRMVLVPLLTFGQERFFTFLAIATLVLLIGIFAVVYPLADAGIVGGGTDRDEALNIAVTEVLNGRYPYYQRTYLHGQITPFPGAFVLAMPFVLLGNSALQNIFWLSWFVLAMKHYFRSGISALLLLWLVCLLSPIVMNGFVTGGDLIANNLYVLLALYYVLRYASEGQYTWKTSASALFLGVSLASRGNFFLLLPLVFSFLVQHSGWKRALLTTALVCATSAAVILPFYFYDPAHFSPLQAANKLSFFDFILPHAGMIIPLVGGCVACGLAFQRMDTSLQTFWRNCALVQAVPSVSIAILAGLPSGQIAQFGWYGMNFLFFGAIACWSAFVQPVEDRVLTPQ